jgi:hypothetical protein
MEIETRANHLKVDSLNTYSPAIPQDASKVAEDEYFYEVSRPRNIDRMGLETW